MALTIGNVATLNLLSQYLVGAGHGPLDGRVAEQLALIFGGPDNCFACQCAPESIQSALRDEPFRTFLRLLVCVSAGAPVGLPVASITKLNLLIRYLAGSGVGPLDGRVAEQLSLIFGGPTSCFSCECGPESIQSALRDEPFRTFIRLLVCVNAGSAGTGSGGDETDEEPIPDEDNFLLTAGTYGILAATTITNTGATFITGDLGLHPGTAVTGAPTVSGTSNVNNAAALQAKNDLTAAYLILAGLASDFTVAGNIGGQTLPPGVYTSASTLEISSGELTLDAQGNADAQFVFQVGSALTVTSGRQVILIGGAQAANVFWQVGSSATLGTTSIFKGSILALTSISALTGAQIEGRLLARNGAVTLDTNAVVVPV